MKIAVLTLGCKVNEYESLSMISQLKKCNYEVTTDLEFADIYIINSCAVTNMAERKSRQMIAKILKLNNNAKIIVSGCASQNNPEQFCSYPNVVGVLGNKGKENIVEYIEKNIKELKPISLKYDNFEYATKHHIRHYIKIQDGCNNFCSYCIIPYTRGRSRSRDKQDILKEIQFCNADEIVLTGINVADYKINEKNALIELLEDIDKLNVRFRLSSLECVILDDNFISRLKSLKNFCPFFHLSLQSGCNETLKRMNRHYTIEQFSEMCLKLKQAFPVCCISTDIIVGFKGETEQEFNTTLTNIKKIPFAFLHVFPYSIRKGTNAEKLKGDIDKLTVKQREKLLLDYSKELKRNFVEENLNITHKLLIEEFDEEYSYGYTENYIYCAIKGNYTPGSVVNVKIEKYTPNYALANVHD